MLKKLLLEVTPPRIIVFVAHKLEKLTKKEEAAQDAFASGFDVRQRKTEKPVLIALIGLVGSGKSVVAKKLAGRIGGTIVEGDAIRVELRRQEERYEHARLIAENVAFKLLKNGRNVILDSDFVDKHKRASILEKAQKAGVRLIFIRTYCDLEVAEGRIITASYENAVDDFFGGADSAWEGDPQVKGAVVKLREMRRRMPHHYDWVNEGGGQWIPKKFPFDLFADIDTTDPDFWEKDVEACADQLLKQS